LAFEEQYKDIECQVCKVLPQTISVRGQLWKSLRKSSRWDLFPESDSVASIRWVQLRIILSLQKEQPEIFYTTFDCYHLNWTWTLSVLPGLDLGRMASPRSVQIYIMFVFGPGSDDSSQTLFQAFSGHSLFAKKKLFMHSSYARDTVELQKQITPTWFSEIVWGSTLQTWHPISLYCSPTAKITSDVFRASLNNLLKDCWHLCFKRNMYQWHNRQGGL
jgi:hypothetical protein